MIDSPAEKPDPWTKVRWTIWFLFLVGWSTALLVPDPIGFFLFFLKKTSGQSVSTETTFWMAKTLHVSAYACAAILTGWLRTPGSWRWVLLLFWFVHAGATEFGQLFVPGRTGSLRDVALDHAGLLLGVAISWPWWRPKGSDS